ncbi:MAG: response regulator transcription factor [Bacillota bacterium]
MQKSKILIVEDEPKIARFIQLECEHVGYSTAIEHDGKRAVSRIAQEQWDIVLLDLMLPGLFGTEVCKQVREFSDVPVIMLTARGETADRVAGLDCGADDYIAKPFEAEELLARIRALLRRRSQTGLVKSDKLTFKLLSLSPERFEAFIGDSLLVLTKKEFDLLSYLLLNQNLVLSREKILQAVWTDDFDGGANVVDVYIRYLRSKLEVHNAADYIVTVRGVGYVLR